MGAGALSQPGDALRGGSTRAAGPPPLVGVIAALPSEAWALGPEFSRVAVQICGAGPERARISARALLDQGVGGLVSWGFAAGLDPRLAAGALVVPSRVVSPEGGSIVLDPAWSEHLRDRVRASRPVHDGSIASADRVLATREDKRALAERTGAIAADMESDAIARVGAESGVPVVVVRAVCDPAEMSLPRCLLGALADDGSVSRARLATGLLARPGELAGMVRLALGFRAARRCLHRVAARAGEDLANE